MSDANVLIVDDDGGAVLSLVNALRAGGLAATLQGVTTAPAALEAAARLRPEVAVLDLCLDPLSGVESGFALLRALLDADPTCRIIMLTGHGSMEYGVRALESGAASFLEKPAEIPHLRALIKDGIMQARLKREYQAVMERRDRDDLSDLILGTSRPIMEVIAAVRYASQTNQPVLIIGETGTGKGLCAAAIHRVGPRRAAHFVRLQPHFGNPDLVQSDLFGHLAGAFTGAGKERRGLLSEAAGGTVFFDEVDELPPETQVALLGVLQDKKFRPLGGNREQEIDFRLIAATNRDVQECLESGKLRRDFYHRIAHYTIKIPALRERKEDLRLLAEAVVRRLRDREQLHVFDVEEDAMDVLRGYDWPGNVREFEAVIEGAVYHAHYEGRSAVRAEDIAIRSERRAAAAAQDFHEMVRRYKIQIVQDALAAHAGNQVQAAKALGIDRATLRRTLEQGE